MLVNKNAAVPSLRKQLNSAGEALAAAGQRAASDSLGDTRLLVPPIDLPTSTSWVVTAAKLPIDGARQDRNRRVGARHYVGSPCGQLVYG